MNTSVAVAQPVVKRFESAEGVQTVTVDHYGVSIRSTGLPPVGLDLADAIKAARAILEFVGETSYVAADERDAIRRFEDAEDARHDAMSAHFLHD